MNEDWSAGYVVETGYTYGCYPELNPVRAALPLLTKGLRAPKIETACELGFGQGCSAAVHAATQPDIEWWGCDFAPAQAVFARDLVAASGAKANFFDDAFDEYKQLRDLKPLALASVGGRVRLVPLDSDAPLKTRADWARQQEVVVRKDSYAPDARVIQGIAAKQV